MAHAFSLTDGTTTISLSTTNVMLENYALTTPETGAETGAETVVDTVDIVIYAATGALVQTAARAIDAMLQAAIRRRNRRTGPRVYIQAQLDTDSSAWRSELLDGRMELAEDALAVWANKQMRATLYLERRPYWEGAETQLPLTNGNGTNDTAGLTVFNCNDGSGSSPNKRHNYLQIAAADVGGAMPAPVKLELKNIFGSGVQWWRMHLCTNAESDPANLTTMIEGEASTAGGADQVDSGSSGGYSLRFAAYSSTYATWTLDAATLQKTAGRWFRLLARLDYRQSTTVLETMQASIWDSTGSYMLYRGSSVAINQATTAILPIVDLGMLPLPPGGYDTTYGALNLRVDLAYASGTTTTDLDYIQLTALDSYRVLEFKPATVANNALIIDNGIDGLAYVEASSVRYPFIQPSGAPLMVYPGKLQRIYVIANEVAGGSDITNKWAARAWYRPRRVTV